MTLLEKYTSIIRESFDSKAEVYWDTSIKAIRFGTFQINGQIYHITISGDKHWSIQFDLAKFGQGISGTGSAYKVFSTVIKTIIDEVERRHPDSIYFAARKNQPSRCKLYKSLCLRINKLLPAYRLDIDDNDREIDFYLLLDNI